MANTIEYDGKVLAEFNNTAIIKCKNKLMSSDIVITATGGGDSIPEYDGAVRDVEPTTFVSSDGYMITDRNGLILTMLGR